MTSRRYAWWPVLLSLAFIACGGGDESDSPPQGGGGSSAGGSAGAGGSKAGSGGTQGGSAGSGGNAAGSAGAPGGTSGGGTGGTGGSGGTGAGAGGEAGAGGTDAGQGGSDAGAGGSDAGSGGDAGSGDAGSGGSDAGTGGDAGAGGAADPCEGVSCGSAQKCENGACVDLTCADLTCKQTETCTDPPDGGAYCEPICGTDLDCPADKYCNGFTCVPDTCKPGSTVCQGDDLHICPPNGSKFEVAVTCGSSTWTSAACVDNSDGKAYCPCFDDWDCPAFTVCEAGVCQGTGKEPTCSLPPVPFKKALPTTEIHWGGTGQGAPALNAINSPFPSSAQVSATPIVANLDDDNGDGLIDERDIPEVIFMTYCGTDISTNGIVRAIHGGGAGKGKDFFATCGSTVWHEGDGLNMACPCANATGNSTAALAVADLDGDGVPEIIVPNETAGLTILNNKGETITQSPANQWTGFPDPAVTVANLDNQGFSELIVGNVAFTLDKDSNGKLIFVDRFTSGTATTGKNGQGPVSCVANVSGDKRPEIVAGTAAFRMPVPPAGVTKIADCAQGATDNFCTGKLDLVWDGQTVNGAAKIANAQRDGFCAVADVLGGNTAAEPSPANPLDGKPEVVLISNGYLLILEGETGKLLRSVNLGLGSNGGAPNVDDFDGDGFPEIGTAFGTRYLMFDLQPTSGSCPIWPNALDDAQSGNQGNPARQPGGACSSDAECNSGAVCNKVSGNCTCLYNGWQRITEDDSSRVTGSSVFDFNGDGAAEVVYGDECFLRVYDGIKGTVLSKINAPSRTRIENPVIADVDNDGNAEIVHATNNDANTCSQGNNFPNGINVLGDASDAWVSARRVWNQHAYHITNVSESSQVPLVEPDSWGTYNGRTYNTYRSNPRSYGVAPDLSVGAIQISSPDVACGQLSSKLVIAAVIENKGDLRVGADVVVSFYGEWTSLGLVEPLYADAVKTPLVTNLPGTLEAQSSVVVSVPYDAVNNSPGVLPDKIRIVVDEADIARECIENNNERTSNVSAGELTADLELSLGAPASINCPSAILPTTVTNNGSAPATNVTVRYYAGDPDQGGTAFHDELFVGPFAAFGGTETRNVQLSSLPPLSVLVYARVDPDNEILECKDSNNKSVTSEKIDCGKF